MSYERAVEKIVWIARDHDVLTPWKRTVFFAEGFPRFAAHDDGVAHRHSPKERQILGKVPRHRAGLADRSIMALRPNHPKHQTATSPVSVGWCRYPVEAKMSSIS